MLGREWATVEELVALYRRVKGNHFARAGLEMACWDALARAHDKPLAFLLGGTRPSIESGVSLGIEEQIHLEFDTRKNRAAVVTNPSKVGKRDAA